MAIFFNHNMKAWKSIQPSPIMLLANHKLQFYYPVKDLQKMSKQFQHPHYLQRKSVQRNNAGNAFSENVRAVGQRDTAKSHIMTATEKIAMRGIAGYPQGLVRTRLIVQM